MSILAKSKFPFLCFGQICLHCTSATKGLLRVQLDINCKFIGTVRDICLSTTVLEQPYITYLVSESSSKFPNEIRDQEYIQSNNLIMSGRASGAFKRFRVRFICNYRHTM